MSFILQPWQLYIAIIAGWIHRQQQEAIEYLRTENRVLRETHGTKRILLNDDQRRRLAVKGKNLGRQRLEQIGTLFTPDTILRWHRTLIAKKWDYSKRRKSTGRPRAGQEIVDLVVRFARENVTWGYDKIQGALANLGHKISDQTVGNILKEHGIEPAPERKRQTTWATFLKAHWDVLGSIDFTTIEVWTKGGLVTYYLLFVMEVATRRVHFAGCTANPDEPWMKQIARNLTDCEDGFLNGKRFLIMDRDTTFSDAFRKTLEDEGVESVRLPPRSPNLNPHLERFMRSLKDESLSRLIFFGETSLRTAVGQFLEHYHGERNHQGLGNQLIDPGEEVGQSQGGVKCRERLGGLLRYYYRDAA
jgi:transposase InsO family protein